MSAVGTVLAWLCIVAGAGLVCGFWVYHHVAWPFTFPWRMRRAMVHLGLVATKSARPGSVRPGLLALAVYAILVWLLGHTLAAVSPWLEVATWVVAGGALVMVLAPRAGGHQPKLHRKRRDGQVWHLVWRMPTGTNTRVEGHRAELEAALDCSLRVWPDGGKLHMRAGRGEVPEVHMLADAERSDAGGITVHLGRSREGQLNSDISAWPHAVVGGTSGGGKSACVQSIVLQVAQTHSPDEVQLVLVDLKGAVDMAVFDGLPHLRWPVIGRHGVAAAALAELVIEQERRQDQLRGVTDKLSEWNRRFPDQALPSVIVVIDEFADLLPKDAATKEEKTEREAAWASVSTLTRMGRASGIHVIIATQRPDADVLPGQIRSNCPVKIAFYCADEFHSGILLGPGNAGAARLPCRLDGQPLPGRAIFKWGREVPFQAAHMPADDIARAVQELRGRYAPLPAPAAPIHQPLPMRSVEEA